MAAKHHVSVRPKYDVPLSQIDSRLVVVLHQRKISLIIMPNYYYISMVKCIIFA